MSDEKNSSSANEASKEGGQSSQQSPTTESEIKNTRRDGDTIEHSASPPETPARPIHIAPSSPGDGGNQPSGEGEGSGSSESGGGSEGSAS